ncbi:hypothetical protein KIP68_10230, partial [Corynebacterium aquatimens]
PLAVPSTWNTGTNYADSRYQLPRIDIQAGERLTQSLTVIQARWRELLRIQTAPIDLQAQDQFIRKPVATAETLSTDLGIPQTEVEDALHRLEQCGILVGAQLTKSTRAWRSLDVLELLKALYDEAESLNEGG